MTIPAMSLREVVMFPKAIVPLFVGRKASIKAIEHALEHYQKTIFLVTQKDPALESPQAEDLFNVGVISKILQMLRLPDGTIKVLFEGLFRATAQWPKTQEPDDEPVLVRAEPAAAENEIISAEGQALVRSSAEALKEYTKVNPKLSQENLLTISTISRPGQMADAVVPHLKIGFEKKQAILEEFDPEKRLELTYALLQEEIEIFSLAKSRWSAITKNIFSENRSRPSIRKWAGTPIPRPNWTSWKNSSKKKIFLTQPGKRACRN
jgi:ATP-dependent Lon protease